jgi:hypothetical protein
LFNPVDFLSEEDLQPADDLEEDSSRDDPEPGMEITAWEDLQTEMIRESLSSQSSEQLTLEEVQEMLTARDEESSNEQPSLNTDFEPIAQVDAPSNGDERATAREEGRQGTDVSLFTPILRMEPREDPRGNNRPDAQGSAGRDEMEFSGSRALFNQLRGNQGPASAANTPSAGPPPSFARPQFEPMDSGPQPPARSRPQALPGSGFGGLELSGSRSMPGTVSAYTQSPSIPVPRQPQRETERFRQPENRIRSQLSPDSGLGF